VRRPPVPGEAGLLQGIVLEEGTFFGDFRRFGWPRDQPQIRQKLLEFPEFSLVPGGEENVHFLKLGVGIGEIGIFVVRISHRGGRLALPGFGGRAGWCWKIVGERHAALQKFGPRWLDRTTLSRLMFCSQNNASASQYRFNEIPGNGLNP
jgi:hypothetical protein